MSSISNIDTLRRKSRHIGLSPRLVRPTLIPSTFSRIVPAALRWPAAVILTLLTLTTPGIASIAQEVTQEDQASVIVLTFEGPITPILERYVDTAISEAETAGADAIVLQLDTPGGSVDVTKSLTQRMLSASVPIIVYVAPDGAHAGSAGAFVTLAAHAAAMAPGASIGAASPVDMSGGDIGSTMQSKVENLLSADIENLAARRGEKATDWAIAAVREAAAATSEQALELGVIDVIAVDVDDLLRQLDGLPIEVRNEPQTLRTAGAIQIPLQLTPLEQFLNFLSNPTIATILLSLGMLGLVVEIRTPGFGVPGVVGIISLLFAFYGLGQLDANFTGLALMAAALVLFVAEAFTPTFGILALGGTACFIFGAALLYDAPGINTPWITIVAVGVAVGAFAVFAGAKAMAAQRRRPITGDDALVGHTATAKDAFSVSETGSVFVNGEWWNAALLSGSVESGDRVRVISREGITLLVEPLPATGRALEALNTE